VNVFYAEDSLDAHRRPGNLSFGRHPTLLSADKRGGLDFVTGNVLRPGFDSWRLKRRWKTARSSLSKDGVEVDLVLERGAREIAGVEIKTSATVTSADFRGLRKLAQTTGNAFKAGVVPYDGESVLPFGNRLFAVLIRVMWEAKRR
jgi:hypothetical protein